MRKIKIYRKNEFVAYINSLKCMIGNRTYSIGVNSSVELEMEGQESDITLRYFWAKKKITLQPDEQFVSIRIRPFVTNQALLTSVILLLACAFALYLNPEPFFSFLFWTFFISAMLIFVFLNTVGLKYFWVFEKESKAIE